MWPEPKRTDDPVKCSFCGKSQNEVQKLIAGPGVNICDKCVALCQDILDEELTEVVMDDPPTDQQRI